MIHHHHLPGVCTCNPSEGATSHPQNVRLLWIALTLVCLLSVAELVVAHWSHSVALLAESGHMLADGSAMGLALVAAWIAQRPAIRNARFGVRRIEAGAACLNGLGLVAIALWIGWEAFDHLQSPPETIASLPMLITASLGLMVNSANIAILHRGSHHDLNLKAAFLHVVADAISSIGVIVAAIAITVLHWLWADGVVSLFVAALILLSAVPLVVESLRCLLRQQDSISTDLVDLSVISSDLEVHLKPPASKSL